MDLTGGYYDAGDNVKYGLPMAFTVTTLAWTALFYHADLQETGELQHVHDAIRWGTDYFLKCSVKKERLYVQVISLFYFFHYYTSFTLSPNFAFRIIFVLNNVLTREFFFFVEKMLL